MRLKFSAAAAVVAALFLLISAGQLFETNSEGFIKVLQVPVSGTMKVVTDPGMFLQVFGDVEEYKETGTYSFGGNEDNASVRSAAIEVRFSDAGRAQVAGNARFDLPTSEPGMLKIHAKFRSYDHLVETLIKPVTAEALIASASLMSAEESYSGRKAEFAQLAEDQLKNGIYLTEWVETKTVDPLTQEQTTKRVVQIKTDKDGQPQRRRNPLAEFNVVVQQFVIDKDLDYENGVDQQIKTARDAFMKTVESRARAQQAEQEQKTAEAEGKRAVTVAEYQEEEKKIRSVVDAQRKLEVAKLARAEAAERKAEQQLLGEGEAARKRAVMQADGALQQKLAAWVEAQKFWAEAHANRKVPQQVFGSGGGAAAGSTTDTHLFMQLLTAQAAKDLALDFGVQK